MPAAVIDALPLLLAIAMVALAGLIPSRYDPPPPLFSEQRWGHRELLIVLGVLALIAVIPDQRQSSYGRSALGNGALVLVIIASVWAVVRARDHRPWRALGLDPATALYEALWALRIALGIASVIAVLVMVVRIQRSEVMPMFVGGRWVWEGHVGTFLAALFVTTVLGSLAEELAFRGAIYTPLFRKLGVAGALLGSAGLWATARYGISSDKRVAVGAAVFVVGIVYGEVYRRRASLVPTLVFQVVGGAAAWSLQEKTIEVMSTVVGVAVSLWIVSIVWFRALQRRRVGASLNEVAS